MSNFLTLLRECGPAYDLVHVLDHNPGLEEERQVHHNVLVSRCCTLQRLYRKGSSVFTVAIYIL
jgi:hypothetical protein